MSGNKIKIFVSFLIGGAVGSAIALLYAPKEGKQLRTDISEKTKEIIEDGKNTTEQVWTETKEKVSNIMDGANELLSKAKVLVTDETKRVKDAVKTGFQKYNGEIKPEGIEDSPISNEEENNKS